MGLLSQRGEEDDDEREAGISLSGLDDLERPEESVYDLADWSAGGLRLLRERLVTLAVPHQWEEETSLVVALGDEAWVERILDQVEDELSASLDADVDQVAYDLTGWFPEARSRLLEVLEDEAVPYGVEDDELFVHEIDEDRVDEIVEAIVDPPEDGDASDPTGGAEPMGELFVAADRVARLPNEPAAALALLDARRIAGASSAPYGMDKAWWDGVLEGADAVLALLDEPAGGGAATDRDPVADEEAVVEAAAALRDALRPYV